MYCLISSLIRLPPRATFFPYTTLFRSSGDIKYDNAAEASAKLFGSPWKFSKHGECGMELSELLPCLGEVADEITLVRSMQDRKSTRLNSSHVSISYAVFCLKKKINTTL